MIDPLSEESAIAIHDLYRYERLVRTPAYSIGDAARYLQLSPSTVRSWVLGRDYPTRRGKRRFSPVIEPAEGVELSFENLAEIHVLSAIRGKGVPLPAVRKALHFLREKLHSKHPLATEQMYTSGKDLFVRRLGQLIQVSSEGQTAFVALLEEYLDRIERKDDLPIRIYPFISAERRDTTRLISIDPAVQFGKPCLAKSGVPVAVLKERWLAGDSIQHLAEDYRRRPAEIEGVLRYAQAA
jgi:uncharacterized protein (DUF433 family)